MLDCATRTARYGLTWCEFEAVVAVLLVALSDYVLTLHAVLH